MTTNDYPNPNTARRAAGLPNLNSLWDRVQLGGTPLLDKLGQLTDDEWEELTHRLTQHLRREMTARGYVIGPADLIDEKRLERALQRVQDTTHIDVSNHRYHCGGTCARAIAAAYREDRT